MWCVGAGRWGAANGGRAAGSCAAALLGIGTYHPVPHVLLAWVRLAILPVHPPAAPPTSNPLPLVSLLNRRAPAALHAFSVDLDAARQTGRASSHPPPPSRPRARCQVPKRRGQDPEADARDKGLQRLATKGVVRLFNAIARAQKQLREAEEATGSRAKAVKLGKASFLAQLKGSGAAAAGAKPGEALVPSAPARQVAAAAAPAARQHRRAATAADSSDDEDAAGWDVLKQGFAGLQGEPLGGAGRERAIWRGQSRSWRGAWGS